VRLLLGVLLTLIEVDRIESGGEMLAKANAIPLRQMLNSVPGYSLSF
jgi:hypothetical protein